MNKLTRELYHLADEMEDNRFLYWQEYGQISKPFDELMEQVRERCGRDFQEALYDAAMDCLSFGEYRSFQLGLRLGMQLHAL